MKKLYNTRLVWKIALEMAMDSRVKRKKHINAFMLSLLAASTINLVKEK